MSSPNEQAVLVHLDATGLPDAVYENCDLATLEGQLESAIASASVGEYDGNESGPAETTLYMYGPNAEALFSSVEPVLRAYPLCQNARVVIRMGSRVQSNVRSVYRLPNLPIKLTPFRKT